ncbi:glycoside hydrolase family 15 protein [Falsirhodobacter sp. 20TX0035]|uniref:glycoside hydrolase family 15 protein n=1 Tax=Falsirhodobacter sp. 20TX0035 TaxID=3022019 RepID=UPI0023311581|nr:glycoside hydrolase family 15 protein [Falsirhodobacter sp. 20TX0035]MDB6452841.1 glycoside hydrolase family 15 protein [Falsirhodobacter sp. 20TX0035]
MTRPLRDQHGFAPLHNYAALGEGRSIALSGSDGSIDWWCAPNMDSPPLFDRLLTGDTRLPDGTLGGYFVIRPEGDYQSTQSYRPHSNVLETRFTTEAGEAVLSESLNSGSAGRLPWCELARRIEVTRGTVRFQLDMRIGHQAGQRSPYLSKRGKHQLFHVGDVLGMLVHDSDRITLHANDDRIHGAFTLTEGDRQTFAIIAGEGEPLVVPQLAAIDRRIDVSDKEWRDWAAIFDEGDDLSAYMLRQALVLKLLLYSPSGAIAAAATTSLPERIGGDKNYDYRFAWVRDAGYTIISFLDLGAEAEAKAALTWLLNQLANHGSRVCFALEGGVKDVVTTLPLPGYRNSQPVLRGNIAARQHQHGTYGDIFETVASFIARGNIIDSGSAEVLSHLADECTDHWRQPDSGIWELPEVQQYTMSKIACWQALSRAVELADEGHLPTTCRDRWDRERHRIAEFIETECWNEKVGAFTMYPGTDRLDASVALAVRFGFDGHDRLRRTLDAIDRKLGKGPFHYRYSGAEKEEGCFLACSFWMVDARNRLGQVDQARAHFDALRAALDQGPGILPEMVDPKDGSWLGNMPQGLTHLAALQAAAGLRRKE